MSHLAATIPPVHPIEALSRAAEIVLTLLFVALAALRWLARA